jgi:hypothetical protein
MKSLRFLFVGFALCIGAGSLFAAEAKEQKAEKQSCCEPAKEKEKESKGCEGGCCCAPKDGEKSEKKAEKKG